MAVNMGSWDRIARLVFAGLFAVFIVSGMVKGTWAVIMGVVGAMFVVTALVNFCPLYSFLGFNTRAKHRGGAPTHIDG